MIMLKPILNIRMLLLALIVISISQTGTSQIVIDSKFKPLSYEELMMQAQAEAAYNAQMKQRFEQYQDEAYRRYNKQDWYGFLTYSNYALETGWYNSQLYYDRGVVYERLNNFRQAKKEYKKAKKKGYAYAERALEACKQHEKEYKRRMKNKRKK